MCGTYAFRKSPREVRALLRDGWHPLDIPDDAWRPSYKIKPSQPAPVITGEVAPALEVMRWGFLPHWMRERGHPQINAKSETVVSKPMFRAAIRQTRCIVLCDGFYEPKGQVQPRPWYFFQQPDSGLVGLAGIYVKGQPDHPASGGFAILTTAPSEDVAPIHDRMPVMLPLEAWSTWLDTSAPLERLASFYAPSEAPRLENWPVPDDAKKASAPDGPNCIVVKVVAGFGK